MEGVAQGSGWIVLEEFERDAAFHMRRDEELALDRLHEPTQPNVLRLYSWNPAALSLGHTQPLDHVDVAACESHGIEVVRRPTGGRAVLHKEELTYAVIWRVPFEISISASHNLIVEALLWSLSALGDAALAISDPRASIRSQYRPGILTNAACFLSTSRHEVTFDGKKTIGSAQRRFGNVLLQHGSILLNREHLLLPELLSLSSEDRSRMRRLLELQTAGLDQVFGRQISIAEAANSVASTFVDHICTAAETYLTKAA